MAFRRLPVALTWRRATVVRTGGLLAEPLTHTRQRVVLRDGSVRLFEHDGSPGPTLVIAGGERVRALHLLVEGPTGETWSIVKDDCGCSGR